MKIRQYATSVGHMIVGSLRRRPDWETSNDVRAYQDEALNEYYISKNGVAIITFDGGIL